jgi:Fe-S cluster assembly protein SufB
LLLQTERETYKKRDMEEQDKILQEVTSQEYKFGFVSDFESDSIPKGLNEDVIRVISAKKNEPEFMLQFRLDAYRKWLKMPVPNWAYLKIPPIDFQEIIYYSAPKKKPQYESLDEVDPDLIETFNKLGIPLEEQKVLAGVAVDAVIDSVSVKTTFKETLAEKGVIFCSFSEAVKEHPDLIKKYLGMSVPTSDNFFAALNSAVFSDGSFCYIPKGVRCPMELSTYFRINASGTGQFERTLIVAEDDSYVSYLEGCTAPMRDENQLHAAVVEIIAMDRAEVKYSTVQNWYPGNKEGKGGVYNFVTKRGICRGESSKISWTQVETGSAITWKYPSVILMGDRSVGEFNSVAVTNNHQQADTGTKMIHIGKNTKSTIISKGISAGVSDNSYRGLVKVLPGAVNSRNFSQCDSLLLGSTCGAHTFPYIEVGNKSSIVEHEATTSKIGEDQIFYCNQRGISTEDAIGMIVNGYAKEVLNKLPMEFAVEAQKLLAISLEGSVG